MIQMERRGTDCQARERDVQANKLMLAREAQGNPYLRKPRAAAEEIAETDVGMG